MKLYLTLVHSQFMYCTPIWRPYLQKNIQNTERIHCLATKVILNDYDINYTTRLLMLKFLPLTYLFELQGIILLLNHLNMQLKASTFFTTSHSIHPIHIHHPTISLNTFHILIITLIDTNFSLECHPCYIYLRMSTIKIKLKEYFWSHFVSNFDNEDPCTFHLLSPLTSAIILLLL